MDEAGFWNEGNRFYGLGEYWAAILHYDRVLLTRPSDPTVLLNVSCCYLQLTRFAEAEFVANELIQITPDCPKAHNLLGTILCKQGFAQGAVNSYKKAITLNPEYAEAHTNCAVALMELGRDVEAEIHGRIATQLDPKSTFAHLNHGAARMRSGFVKASMESFRKVLAIDPTAHDAHSNLIFAMDLDEDSTIEQQCAERIRWGQQHAAQYYPQHLRT